MAGVAHNRLMRPGLLLLLLGAVAATVLLLWISLDGSPSQTVGSGSEEPIAVAGASPATTSVPAAAAADSAISTVADGGDGASWPATAGRYFSSAGSGSTGGVPPVIFTAAITGFVSSGELIPLAGINVFLADVAGVLTGQSVTTDTSGSFRLAGLAGGAYRVFFSDPAGRYRSGWYGGGSGSPVGVGDRQEVNLVFSMLRENVLRGSITGNVTGPGGLGMAGVEVLVYEVDPPVVLLELRQVVVTAADGSYSVTGLAPGNYKVLFQPADGFSSPEWYRDAADNAAAELIALLPGETVGKVDAALVQGGRVSGQISHDGSPAAFALVDVFDQTGVIVDSAVTNSLGFYVSNPLPAGFYKVRVAPGSYGSRWYDGRDDFGSADWVQIIGGQVTAGIDIQLTSVPPVVSAEPAGAEPPADPAPDVPSEPLEPVAATSEAEDTGVAGDDEEKLPSQGGQD